MPALPDDIVRSTRSARIEVRADSAVLTAHGNARDQNGDPVKGFFETAADAASALIAISSLVGTFRRRFQVRTESVLSINPLTAIPTYNLVDSEHNVAADGLVTRIEVDLHEQRSNVELLV